MMTKNQSPHGWIKLVMHLAIFQPVSPFHSFHTLGRFQPLPHGTHASAGAGGVPALLHQILTTFQISSTSLAAGRCVHAGLSRRFLQQEHHQPSSSDVVKTTNSHDCRPRTTAFARIEELRWSSAPWRCHWVQLCPMPSLPSSMAAGE